MTEKQDNTHQSFRRHDFVVAALFWLISAFIFVDSIRLTFDITLPGIETNVWLVAPGLLPLFFSGGLLLMFTWLLFVSAREGAFRGHFTGSALRSGIANRETLSKLIQMLLLVIYVFGLLGRVHFGIASGLYLIAAMLVARAARPLTVIIISVVFSGLITFVFGTLMKIPLP